MLQLRERERLHLRELKAARVGNELEPYEDARLSQIENLARRLRQGLGRECFGLQENDHFGMFVGFFNLYCRESGNPRREL